METNVYDNIVLGKDSILSRNSKFFFRSYRMINNDIDSIILTPNSDTSWKNITILYDCAFSNCIDTLKGYKYKYFKYTFDSISPNSCQWNKKNHYLH